MNDRAERRRQLAIDRARFAQGLDVTVRDGRQIAGLMRVVHDLVRTSIAKGSVTPLIEFLHDNTARASRRFADVPIACGRQCSHCCHMWVDAGAAEILYIAKSLSGQRRSTAIAAIAQARSTTGHLSFDERGVTPSPCPMLQNDACSIYAARPLVCRAAASTDADQCRRAYLEFSGEDIPLPLPWLLLGSGYRLALSGAVKQAGLHYRAIELNSGLEVALRDSGAERRWLSGENPFENAVAPPTDDIFEIPIYRQIYSAAFD